MPFDKITDCGVVEPAGNECLCIPRVLFKVRIDTASSSKDQHELVLAGIRNPHEFKKLVWAMKRSQQQTNVTQQPNALEMIRSMPALAEGSNAGAEDITCLLEEIRDELRLNNEAMKMMQTTPTAVVPEMVDSSEDGKFV